ncbi:serine/threonine-protein kinase [uncultured Paraglaciecola sp.]|uniref:serine/threonine protein kinase n=1 Tax=uncultured Paraglaciecola sp. TaxID=1765024 RepID=UPI0030D9D197|tara:strand:- start:84369 stop:86063 length:1695 start_codon:yes stop_codon:yes gene_type:complete
MTKKTSGFAEDNDATVVFTAKGKAAKDLLENDDDTRVSPSVLSPQDDDGTVISSVQTDNQIDNADSTVVPTSNKKTSSDQGKSKVVAIPQAESATAPDNQHTVKTRPPQKPQVKPSNTHAPYEATGSFTTGNSNRTYSDTKNPLTNTYHKPFVLGGEAIKERFIIQKILGQGGMGMVCQALDLRRVEAEDDAPYIAIKLLSNDFEQYPNAFKSLQSETRKTQALAHPNIITVYDFDRDGDTVFMTMEELDGYPLDAVIKGTTDVVLDPKSALKIVKEIALALKYAHSKGIVHSDLKPGNIFYTKTGQTKVLDFGIARALNSELYKDNFDAGELNALTPRYASLEMFENGDPDPRDDIYALGIIAGELLGGGHPYLGKKATQARDGKLKPVFSKSLGLLYKKAITKAVALNRNERTQSASQFLSNLNWAEKGPRRVMAGIAVALLLVIGNVFLIESVDTRVPLTALPPMDQQSVMENIAEADTALSFQDYNGALIYLERVYELHPSNEDVEQRSEQILKVFREQLQNKQDDADYRQFMRTQLVEVGKYKFMANNEQYQALQKQLR